MAELYVDIAIPTAVQRVFTYNTRRRDVKRGMRVWVPFRNTYAIGMVVRVHSERPEFETRPVEQILDDEPVMDEVMLKLTEWVHRFYYCSHGEVIQAALPVGLNFTAEEVRKVERGSKGESGETGREILRSE